MDGAIACGSCQHVKALHRVGGPFRLNGCPCRSFSVLPDVPVQLAIAPPPSRVLAIATRVAAAAISFVAGVLVGQNL